MDKKILNNLIKGTTVTTLGSVLSMGFHFISIFFITRNLSIEDFGIYALIIAISGLLNLLSSMGLEISIVKFISEGAQYRNQLLRPTLELKTLTTILVTLLFFFLYQFYPTDGFTRVWDYNLFTVAIFILGSYRDFFYRVLQGVNKFRKYTYVQIFGAVSRVVIILVFIYFYNLTLENLLLTEVLTIALSVLFQIFSIPFNDLWSDNSNKHYKYILKFSSPLFANNLITFAYDRIGIFIIGILLTASSVAIFDIASRLPSAILGIISSFILVFFPNISTLFSKGDIKNAERLINFSLKFFSITLSLLIILVFAWRSEIMVSLFSSKYSAADLPFVIMMISLLLRTLANILGYGIVSAGYSKIPMLVNLVAMIIGTISTIILVYYYGYIGAAISTIILNGITLIQYLYYYKKLNLVDIDFSFAKSFLLMTSLLVISFFVQKINFYFSVLPVIIFLLAHLNDIKIIQSQLVSGKTKF